MIFRKGEIALLFPFYLYYFIMSLSGLVFPFVMIYFLGLGFTFFQISILFASFSVATFLFEIPTGSIADSFSRKYSVIFGFLITSLAVFFLGYFSSFLMILISFTLFGIGNTFISGAEEAWVIDNLNHHKRKDLHQEFFIKSYSIQAFAGIFAPLIGAAVVKFYSIRPLWYIFSAGLLLCGLQLLIFGDEKYKPKKLKLIESFKETFSLSKKGLKYSLKNNNVKYLIFATLFLAIVSLDFDYWQPFLTGLNMPVYLLGILFSLLSLVGAIMPFLTRHLQKYRIKNVLSLLILFRILIVIPVLFLNPSLVFLGMGIFILGQGSWFLERPLIGPFFQKHLPKKIRATVTSLKSMSLQLGMGLGILLFGFLADIIGVQRLIPTISLFGLFGLYFLRKIKD